MRMYVYRILSGRAVIILIGSDRGENRETRRIPVNDFATRPYVQNI